ncbi:MAG: hypothetical protein QMD44_05955 [Thermodesulfovibrionales bacterium]|jgi:glutamyl-tRNA reductase|nr:hypothetical protein [Thermodesulfovibrionales bacterium]
MKINIKHNIEKAAIDVLKGISGAIEETKKEMHQRAAEAIKADIKEHYDEAFQQVVNPDSSWQKLKQELGLQAKPGHFTSSTLNSIVAEATEEMGKVMLKGKWPDKAKKAIIDRFEFTPEGIRIKPYRDDSKGIRTKGFLIPAEDFEDKRYGTWTGEDIQFMKVRPEAERNAAEEVKKVLDAEINRVLGKLSGRKVDPVRQHINELFKRIKG